MPWSAQLKRVDLIWHLEATGCILVWEGAKHGAYLQSGRPAHSKRLSWPLFALTRVKRDEEVVQLNTKTAKG